MAQPAVNLSPEILAELNGTVFLHNESGEAENDTRHYYVLVDSNLPGALDTSFFCQDPIKGTGNAIDPIVLNANQSKTFLTDNYIWLRSECGMPAGAFTDDQAYELIYFKYLLYRHRIGVGNVKLEEFHVRYNDVKIEDPNNATTNLHKVRNVATRKATENAVANWYNNHRQVVQNITKYLSNILCTVAYTFRQLGHHYIDGSSYEETYRRIWNKVTGSGIDSMISSTWQLISTIGLHGAMPIILDGFWTFCVTNGRCAASLVIRHKVPCAGTAAPFALLVGWTDARSIYGKLLEDAYDLFEDLEDLVNELKQKRLPHGINATYYGAVTARLDMTKYQAMAATIDGVYEACAPKAMLLKSKSLIREATGAPLQKDIAKLSAKHMRVMCAKKMASD